MSSDMCDLELSTPDNTIDSEQIFCHIAQQERTFSEENMTYPYKGSPVPERRVQVVVHSMLENRSEGRGRGKVKGQNEEKNDGEEARVVYAETENDNSCVVDICDDGDDVPTMV